MDEHDDPNYEKVQRATKYQYRTKSISIPWTTSLPIVQSAVSVLASMATFDEAGVSEG